MCSLTCCSSCLADSCLIISLDLLLDWPILCGGALARPGEVFLVTPDPADSRDDREELLKESALDTLLLETARLPAGLRRDLLTAAVAAKKLPLSFSNVLLAEGLSNVLLVLVLQQIINKMSNQFINCLRSVHYILHYILGCPEAATTQ